MNVPEKLGPYRLMEELGRGGMAIVYRGVHVDTGEIVALKTVYLPKGNRLAGLRTEIQALKRIQHPCIVRILDAGLEEWLPWYAMELLEGQTLRAYIRDLWSLFPPPGQSESMKTVTGTTPTSVSRTVSEYNSTERPYPDAWQNEQAGERPKPAGARPPAAGGRLIEALTIVQRICEPLAYLHSCGIVHRDLTPGNLFIRENGSPVIMDFGLVSRLGDTSGREIIEVNGAVLGTIAYISPEQIRGQLVDARSDLYALGCILYELTTGRMPFSASLDSEVMGMHLVRPPTPPSELVEGVPPELSALILRLLAKESRDRLGYADDVARILLSVCGVKKAEAGSGERDYLYRPQFVGREKLLSKFVRHLDRARDRVGRCVLVSGESGAGKTRFAMAITREAVIRGLRVVTGECTPVTTLDATDSTRGAPLHPFQRIFQALADYCREQGRDATDRVLGKRGKVLAGYEPALRYLPGQEEYPEPPSLPAQATRRRLLDAFRDTLAQFAADRPLLVILDDLQWADELSLSFLMYLGESFFKQNPVIILGTYRSEEFTGALREVLDRSWIEAIELSPLDEPAISAMVSDMLALPSLPAEYAHLLARRSMGNPFFVSECLRAFVAERLLCRTDGQWRLRVGEEGYASAEEMLPGSLRELIQRRLRRLSPAAMGLLEAAAVLGREVDADILIEVNGGARDTALAGLRELTESQVFEEAPGDRVRFVHDKMREVAYGELVGERRRALHAAAAAAIEARYKDHSSFTKLYSAMGLHLRRAGDLRKAIAYLDKAGVLALASFATGEAVRCLSDALTLDEQTGLQVDRLTRTRWLRQLATAYIGLGKSTVGMEKIFQGLSMLGWPMPSSRPRLLLGIAAQASRQFVRLFVSPRPERRSTEERAILQEAARAYELLLPVFTFTTGNVLQLLYGALAHLNVAEMAGAPAEMAVAYSNAQVIIGLIPLFSVAEAYGRRAHQALSVVNDPVVQSWVYMMTSGHAAGVASWEKAFTYGGESAAIAEEIGFKRRWEEAHGILGIARFLHGDFERAIETSHQRLGEAALRGDTQTQVWAASGLAQAYLNMGLTERALEAAEWAERCLATSQGRNERIFAYGVLALASLRTGDHRRALEAAEKGAAAVREGRPSTHYCINSYSFITEVFLELLAQGRGAPPPDHAKLMWQARSMCGEMRRAARVYPAVRARSLLLQGRYERLRSALPRAVQLWKKSLATARLLDMPFEEGLAELSLAQVMPIESEERNSALLRARACFTSLKADYDLGRVEKELAVQTAGDVRAVPPGGLLDDLWRTLLERAPLPVA